MPEIPLPRAVKDVYIKGEKVGETNLDLPWLETPKQVEMRRAVENFEKHWRKGHPLNEVRKRLGMPEGKKP